MKAFAEASDFGGVDRDQKNRRVIPMYDWFTADLVCPRDQLDLRRVDTTLVCPNDHSYPVVDDIPVMLLDDVEQTMDIAHESLKHAQNANNVESLLPHLYLETLGISDEEKRGVLDLAASGKAKVDPVVSYMTGATNGLMYKHLIGRVDAYPIPELRLPDGDGQTLLDIGCNWGRWSIAAARKGYSVVGVDPSLGAIMAARRVSQSLGLSNRYLVADARFLPFRLNHFDNVFSYSVIQHLSHEDARKVLSGAGRVLKKGGTGLVQMPTSFGLRCLYHQAKRRFRKPQGFEVRYRSVPELKRLFRNSIGKTEVSVDCYFGIGIQKSDSRYMPLRLKLVIIASETLRSISRVIPFLKYVADSVYLKSVKE